MSIEKSMGNTVCFGEALIDFLNLGALKQDGVSVNDFRQYPGGAPANVAVAIAKLGGNASFMGQVGADQFGDFLIKSLSAYGVDTTSTIQSETAKTALAFVFLDDSGERSFLFHRHDSADLVLDSTQLDINWFNQVDIFHFCSNTLTEAHAYSVTEYAVERAIDAGAIISFDVNLRHNLWKDGKADPGLINQIMRKADVLKFSLDELEYLCHGHRERYIADLLKCNAALVLITNGGEAVEYFSRVGSGILKVPQLDVKDTTAGGDAFVGGLLYQLAKTNDLRMVFDSHSHIEAMIDFAIRCGAVAVSREGAYPALPTLDDVTSFTQ